MREWNGNKTEFILQRRHNTPTWTSIGNGAIKLETSNSGEMDSTLGRTTQRSYTREAKLGTVLAIYYILVITWSYPESPSFPKKLHSSAICGWGVSQYPIWTFQWQAFLFAFLFTCARSFKAVKRLRTMKWIATLPKVLIQRSVACQILSI